MDLSAALPLSKEYFESHPDASMALSDTEVLAWLASAAPNVLIEPRKLSDAVLPVVARVELRKYQVSLCMPTEGRTARKVVDLLYACHFPTNDLGVNALACREGEHNDFSSKSVSCKHCLAAELAAYFWLDELVPLRDLEMLMGGFLRLKPQFGVHRQAARWFLNAIQGQQFSTSWNYIVFEAVVEIRKCFADLILSAIRCLAPAERSLYVYSHPDEEDIWATPREKRATTITSKIQMSSVAHYIDFHLLHLESTRKYWETFQEYFYILHQVSLMSFEERRYLRGHRMLFWLFDYYMGEYSIFATTHTAQRPQLGPTYVRADLREFFALMSTMVRHTRGHGETAAHQSPLAYPDDPFEQRRPLDACAIPFMIDVDLLRSVMRERYNTDAMSEILEHLSWNDPKTSLELVQQALVTLSLLQNVSLLPNVFGTIRALVRIPDSLQPRRVAAVLHDSEDIAIHTALQLINNEEERNSGTHAWTIHSLTDFLFELGQSEADVCVGLWECAHLWVDVEAILTRAFETARANGQADASQEIIKALFSLNAFSRSKKLL